MPGDVRDDYKFQDEAGASKRCQGVTGKIIIPQTASICRGSGFSEVSSLSPEVFGFPRFDPIVFCCPPDLAPDLAPVLFSVFFLVFLAPRHLASPARLLPPRLPPRFAPQFAPRFCPRAPPARILPPDDFCPPWITVKDLVVDRRVRVLRTPRRRAQAPRAGPGGLDAAPGGDDRGRRRRRIKGF